MNSSHKIPSVADRFNEFHLEVGVYTENVLWILERLEWNSPAIGLIYRLTQELDAYAEQQDCRENHLIEVSGNR